ncbi:MAG: flagellar biosynthesis protein FlhF [Desulfobulbaceae bacterium]|nr:flagellar biosynthesis protein FlhF [Desulfobulbaceae bacterium]HIJ77728.1 flagellar biosynthesis protein FlhF [Deltaproteobacteria bacterium]
MRIKRFEATDTTAALIMIKKELGENAVILSTRHLTKNTDGGAPGRPRVEVVAAMEYDQDPLIVPPPDEPIGEEPLAPAMGYGYQPARRMPATDAPAPPGEFDRKLAAKINPAATQSEKIHLESSDLKMRFTSFLKRQHNAKTALDEQLPNNGAAAAQSRNLRPDPKQVAQWRDKIIDKLQIKPLKVKLRNTPTVVALVGPTGVGKTTTAAKIAAWHSIHEGLKVALLSMDCYRIGATDQLRTYARIMRLPCEIALRKKDLAAAIARHQDKDLIIIDTAGKSPYDLKHITELQEWFAASTRIEPHLVLNATLKKEDLQHIINTYQPLKVKGLILAKLDETRAYATLCQQVADTSIPISCLCTGQRVPEDFLLASKEFLQTLFGQGWPAAITEFENETQGQWTQ